MQHLSTPTNTTARTSSGQPHHIPHRCIEEPDGDLQRYTKLPNTSKHFDLPDQESPLPHPLIITSEIAWGSDGASCTGSGYGAQAPRAPRGGPHASSCSRSPLRTKGVQGLGESNGLFGKNGLGNNHSFGHTLTTPTFMSQPSIQRALFFRPGTKADVEGVDLEHVILNPFLMQTYGESPSGWHKIDFIAPGARLQASCHKMFLSQPPTAFCLDYILVGATKTRCDELYGDFLGKPQLCTYAAVDKRIDVVMMRENLVAAQLVGSRIKFVKKQGSEGTKQ
ncbi:hypothetical protein LTR10_002706 [Elasticomyces elasticus]|nr:hypothetical protein LTR10_002706 [Elasticomyces elasticus]